MGQGNIRNENTRSNDMFNSPYAKGGMQTNGPVKPEYASGGGLNQNPGGTQQGGMQNPEGFTQQQQPWNQWGYFGQTGGMSGAYTPVGGGLNQNPGGLQQQAPSGGNSGWTGYAGFNPLSVQAGPQYNSTMNGQSGMVIRDGSHSMPGNPGAPVGGTGAPYDTAAWGQGPGNYQESVHSYRDEQGNLRLNQGAPNPGQPGQATNAPNASIPAGPTMPRFQTGTTIGNGADNPRRFMQRPSLSPQQMQQLTRGGQRPPANAYTPGDGYIELPPGPVGY